MFNLVTKLLPKHKWQQRNIPTFKTLSYLQYTLQRNSVDAAMATSSMNALQ